MNTLRLGAPDIRTVPDTAERVLADTMDDMNEPRDAQSGPQQGSTGTTDPSGSQGGPQNGPQYGPSGPQYGPRVSGHQMRDVNRLRRSKSDRYIAGVAGGLGRHFDVDPTIIRVVLAVLTFFGGAGILVYGVIWLFVAEDGEEHAPVELNPDILKIVLIVTGAIALMIVFGTPFFNDSWGWGFPFPLLVIGLIVFAIFATRDQRRRGPVPPPPWGAAPSTPAGPGATPGAPAPSYGPTEGTTMSTTDTHTDPYPTTSYQTGPPPPLDAAADPGVRAAAAAASYRRGAVLAHPRADRDRARHARDLRRQQLREPFGVRRPGRRDHRGDAARRCLRRPPRRPDRPRHRRQPRAGRHQRHRGLDRLGDRRRDLEHHSDQRARRAGRLPVPNGQISLDLSGVRDVAALDGRTIDIHLNAGEIDVTLPRGVNAIVDAEMHFAGDISVDGSHAGGFDQSLTRTITGSTDPNAPTITLDLDARVGQITVDQD